MTPEERAEIGEFAGAKVDTGVEAEAFSRYIGGHLVGINEGATYSETSAAAREEGLDPDVAADLQVKADTLFKGESLRAMLLNAYGWWTVSTIAIYAGYAMVIAGLLLGILAFLGFRHARRATPDRRDRVGTEAAARSRKGLAAGRRLTPSERWNRALRPLFGTPCAPAANTFSPMEAMDRGNFCHERAVLSVQGPLGTTPVHPVSS